MAEVKVITKKNIVDDVSTKFDLTKKDSTEVVNFVFEEITKALKKGNEVNINGFGKFSVVKKKARTGLNPATGEKIKIKATKSPKFKASKTLKDAVK
ncbi:MAG: HU family DNA-binding protein [Erysipelotrichaceae bacterium]|nr:HU family DNA-binding protein [Erysipelotrichaceae bacterium]